MGITTIVTIYFKDDRAVVDLGNGYFLGIGCKADVLKENAEQLAERVKLAYKMARFTIQEEKVH